MPLRQANRIRCNFHSKSCWVRALPRAPRAFVARDFVQERTNFVQERNFGCLAFIRRTCAASGVALRSTPVRTSRQTTWETRNDLENSEGCRSAGGHGNQHVRLRSAQVDSIKAICPAPTAYQPFRAGQACASHHAMTLRPQDLLACFEEAPSCAAVCNDPRILHGMSFAGSVRSAAAMAHDLSPDCARVPSGQCCCRFRPLQAPV
jgi:hypothetical protein